MSRVHALLGITPPDQSPKGWHVSAQVDLAAYAFSWLWILIPISFLGDDRRVDYLGWYLLLMTLTFLHRHVSFPYIYLDRQVFDTHPLRFTVVPLLLFAAFVASPVLERTVLRPREVSLVGLAATAATALLLVRILWKIRRSAKASWWRWLAILAPVPLAFFAAEPLLDWGRGWSVLFATLVSAVFAEFWLKSRREWLSFRFLVSGITLGMIVALAWMEGSAQGIWPVNYLSLGNTVNFLALIAALWNIWHVYMQKYGILRLYNAKAEGGKVPGWVDRWLIFGWLPLYFVYLGPASRSLVLENFRRGKAWTMPLLDFLEAAGAWLLLPSIGLVAASILCFLYHEWRSNRFRSAPRIWMAAGMTGLSACFLFVHPIKAYVAFAFSHAVEYMVFVWAFQRRRYSAPLVHQPLLGRFLRYPFLSWAVFLLTVGGLYFLYFSWGRYIWVQDERPRLAGFTVTKLIFWWSVYQSMLHFYYDGFLWKMRLSTTRAHL